MGALSHRSIIAPDPLLDDWPSLNQGTEAIVAVKGLE